ncbi:MAG: mtnA, partial [Chloroflexi bacterium]|nr:mtnA [Chloroflexota bacterium]
MTSAAQVVGAVAEVRDRSAAEAQALLAGDPPATGRAAAPSAKAPAPSAAPSAATSAVPEPPTGFRTPFRFDADDVLLVIDQRALPEELIEIPVRNAYDGARVIRTMAVRGAPAIGQVAALSLALSGRLARNAPPKSREQIIRGASMNLAEARPTAVNLGWAVRRVMAAAAAAEKGGASGGEIAEAMRAEADKIVSEATDDHGDLAAHGLAVLPDTG